MHIPIVILKKPTPGLRKEINLLIAGLSLTATPPPPLTPAQFKELLEQKNVSILAAYETIGKRKKIIGFLTMYVVRIPSGITAMAEDFLVYDDYRKWGVGRMLMEHAIDLAEKKGARHLNLRTSSKRIEANQLYTRMGFHLHITNFYRINLPRTQ
ncbi:MAG: GNAT family N-acetyltransferase [Patescibacteria group bacterium]